MNSQLDVIVPVFNEAKNIRPLVNRIHTALRQAKIKHTILIVDDHSTDRTVAIAKRLQEKFPIQILTKQGQRGKAFSILEGAAASTAPYVVMIDADLQYAPEAIPEMLALTQEFGVVVARRNVHEEPFFRKVMSKGFRWFFGKVLHGLDCDVQSGLKIFKRDILLHVPVDQVTAWTLDIPLLTTALDLGYKIGEIGITFEKRQHGESKIHLLNSIREIGGQAVSYKMKRNNIIPVAPESQDSMVGAGILKKGQKYVTHSTLQSSLSAVNVLTPAQKTGIFALLFLLLSSFLFAPQQTAIVFVGTLSFIYFADVFFNLHIILKSLQQPPEIHIPQEELDALKNSQLPMYTILCPLYKEAHVLPQFVQAIKELDWPKKKLDVILLLEADDIETIAAAKKMRLPSFITVQVVPDSLPKTKPKACNYGLNFAKGKFLVIYDAEDKPEPLQLKKVFIAFQKLPETVKCIQAKLNFYNPHQNLLTRFFTAEYSLWFDVVLTGLQTLSTSLPLGGTSNHFRTAELKELQGWDPFNVTEDADLGIRLFKRGATTAIIDSITLEEANSSWHNWLRQRSRWIKGYMQTYLVHMRHPVDFFREYGVHALMFQLIMGGKISFMLINPFMWLLTLSYFLLYAWLGPAIEALYPTVVFYMAVTSLLFGNFLFLFYYMIGAAKREHWTIIKWTFLIPVYWLMVSISAGMALYQLIVKPHYWEKTVHGLHMKKEELEEKIEEEVEKTEKLALAALISQAIEQSRSVLSGPFVALSAKRLTAFKKIHKALELRKNWRSVAHDLIKGKYQKSVFLVFGTMLANVLNMITNLYLGRELSIEDFAVYNTYLSILNMIAIVFTALSTSVNQQSATLYARQNEKSIKSFWVYQKNRYFIFSMIVAFFWLVSLPLLNGFFRFHSVVPLLFFTPIFIIGGINAINQGYLRGMLAFQFVAITTVAQPLIRLLLAVIFGESAYDHFAYLAIPGALLIASIVSTFLSSKGEHIELSVKQMRLSKSFFGLAMLTNLSSIAFFTLDNIFVAHHLTDYETGLYGIMGVLGKMIFFTGGLISSFILPITAFREGKGLSSNSIFKKLLALNFLLSGAAWVAIGVVLPVFFSSFFGEKIQATKDMLPIFTLGILLFTISQSIVQFHLAKKHYLFAFTSFGIALVQVIGLQFFHGSLWQVVWVMLASGATNFVVLMLLHFLFDRMKGSTQNFQDFFDLLFGKINFFPRSKSALSEGQLRILMFNWRDTKHVWAGGAETYMHEIAKGLIAQGHKVTLFCGNDGKNARNEVIDGVQVIRRGGFVTVYVWAFLYYVLKLRKHFDLVIDSENGIPFLTPLYVRKPIFLLIHHVHQEIFRTQLRFPFSEIAAFIEADLMPLLYRSHTVITVSESSRAEIMNIGLGSENTIEIVHPGIHTKLYKNWKKTVHPSLVYVGRLKPYKNLDTALLAFAEIKKKQPKAQFSIAGTGESKKSLVKLVNTLGLQDSVHFLGKITDEEKAKLFAQSWVAVQPSFVEGWGITVIEANACGTPVVASNVKGLRDSVVDQSTGILVPLKDTAEMSAAILSLFRSSRKRTAMSGAAKKWAHHFDWKKSAEEMIQVITRNSTIERPTESKAKSFA